MHVVVYHDHYRKGWKWWVSLLYIGIILSILGTFWYILLAGDWRAASFLQFLWLNHHEQNEWFKLKLKLSWNGWHRCVGYENEGKVSVWRHHIFIRYEIVIVSNFPHFFVKLRIRMSCTHVWSWLMVSSLYNHHHADVSLSVHSLKFHITSSVINIIYFFV